MKFPKLIPGLGLLALFIASFGDEVASITFSFGKVDSESMTRLSWLMTCPLLGGVLSAPLSIHLLNRYPPRRILGLVFLACGAVCLATTVSDLEILVYAACFILGALGTVFWCAFGVLVTNCFQEEELAGVNQLTQSIRNAGYILAPMIAGYASGNFSGEVVLVAVAVVFFASILFVPAVFRGRAETPSPPTPVKGFQAPRVLEFLRVPKMATTMLPLTVTILTTSVFNVAFIHYLLVERGLSKTDYGLIVSGISVGLVVGPLLMRFFKRLSQDHAVVACLAAATIGLCVSLSGMTAAVIPLFLVLFLLGVANSVQNASMATLAMLVMPKERRAFLMPTYIFIIQVSVLSGFLVAGLLPTKQSAMVLIVGGAIAMVAGATGALLNYYLGERMEICSA